MKLISTRQNSTLYASLYSIDEDMVVEETEKREQKSEYEPEIHGRGVVMVIKTL